LNSNDLFNLHERQNIFKISSPLTVKYCGGNFLPNDAHEISLMRSYVSKCGTPCIDKLRKMKQMEYVIKLHDLSTISLVKYCSLAMIRKRKKKLLDQMNQI
jgi:hypothetical protein